MTEKRSANGLVAAKQRVSRHRPKNINSLEASVLHPAQLLGKRRRYVHRIGILVDVPLLSLEELPGTPVAVDLLRATSDFPLPSRGKVSASMLRPRLHQVG